MLLESPESLWLNLTKRKSVKLITLNVTLMNSIEYEWPTAWDIFFASPSFDTATKLIDYTFILWDVIRIRYREN